MANLFLAEKAGQLGKIIDPILAEQISLDLMAADLAARNVIARRSGGILSRAWKIYRYHLFLVAGMLVAAMLLWSLRLPVGPLAPYIANPFAFPLASAALISGSMHMGILPMYVVFMLATPYRLLSRGHLGSVVIGSLALWLFAQTGVCGVLLERASALLVAYGREMSLGLYFDLAGWQILFVAGLISGFLGARGRLNLDWLHRPVARSAAKSGLIVFVLLALLDRAVYDTWISAKFSRAAQDAADRGRLAPIYVLAVALDGFLIAWLLVAGPGSPRGPVRLIARLVHRTLTHPVLTYLGRYGLQIFAFHIVLVYATALVTGTRPLGEAVGSLTLIAVTALIFGVPLALDGSKRRPVRAAAGRFLVRPRG